jgi:hypothetical protein
MGAKVADIGKLAEGVMPVDAGGWKGALLMVGSKDLPATPA